MDSSRISFTGSMGNINIYKLEEKKMIKAFNDVMVLGAGGTILVIAYLLTSVLTGWICISYFTWKAHEEKKEREMYKKILEDINESE